MSDQMTNAEKLLYELETDDLEDINNSTFAHKFQ